MLLAYLRCFNLYFLFQSSSPVELTEAETEYAVNVVKHIFDNHVVFQYNCTNTIPEQLLERVLNHRSRNIGVKRILLSSFLVSLFWRGFLQVNVIVDASEAEEFSELTSKALNSLPYDSPGQAFVAFEKPAGVPAVGKFSNTLTFVVKEVHVAFHIHLNYYLFTIYTLKVVQRYKGKQFIINVFVTG